MDALKDISHHFDMGLLRAVVGRSDSSKTALLLLDQSFTETASALRGPVKSRSFRFYELLRGPQGKRRSAHSALERPGRMSIFSAAVTQIMIYVPSFSIKKRRVFEGGTQNVEREVGRPAKCVGSFEDGFGEITSPSKNYFNKIFCAC